ncbi:MAG: aspartyl-tRNA synthetase [Bacteriovoracaceae bacterium]|nr:aspartyl-tRNA synthetase [Bacteriovoracaceae bacterium]
MKPGPQVKLSLVSASPRFLHELKRTHHNGELTRKDLGKNVVLMGWIQTRRDHGGVIFADLRDLHGITQIVFNPQTSTQAHSNADQIRSEFCLAIQGTVSLRPEGMQNPNLKTGEIEILVTNFEIFNASQTPPFPIENDIETNEMVRLEYRYLDLRREKAKAPLLLRSKLNQIIRSYLDQRGFFELETPSLTKSTPEGARDYLVPSRLYPGEAYALPQSPQLFKQLFMVAGFEKYFQIVRCFRDEDLRADRQPEFTQLDLEMSFINQEDVFSLMEGLWRRVWKEILNIELPAKFERIPYRESVSRFGSDKPDLRLSWELKTVTDIFKNSEFKVFRDVSEKGLLIQVLRVPGGEKLSRKDLDDLTPLGKTFGAKGIAWVKLNDPADHVNGWQSPIAKFLSSTEKDALIKATDAKAGDVLVFCADTPKIVGESLGSIRLHLGRKLQAFNESEWRFVWVVDFPMFQWDAKEKRWVSEHHPFTSPKREFFDTFMKAPDKAYADCYDLVLNGMEMGSGSIRIHKPEMQKEVFKLLGLSEKEMEDKFGFLLSAFSYGAPPHGGVAFGIDRFAMILSHRDSLRDVIAFPKTQRGQCPMTKAPSKIDLEQWKELHLVPILT